MLHNFRKFLLILVGAVTVAVLLSGCSSGRKSPEEREASMVKAMMRAGDKSRNRGDFNAATAFYRRAHEAEPDKPAPLIGLGKALAMGGAPRRSATAFRKALVLDPENAAARRGLGNAMIAQDQPDLAIQEFEKVLGKNPKDYLSYNGLGVAYDAIADHTKAQEYYYAGLEIVPGDVSLRNNLGLSLAFAGHYKGAIEILQPLALRPGASPRDRQNLALAYGLSGDTLNAEKFARLDMDRQTVRRNLNYYAALRKMTDPVLRVKSVRAGYVMKPTK
jgi:Flp pilus assembly protein TadD